MLGNFARKLLECDPAAPRVERFSRETARCEQREKRREKVLRPMGAHFGTFLFSFRTSPIHPEHRINVRRTGPSTRYLDVRLLGRPRTTYAVIWRRR